MDKFTKHEIALIAVGLLVASTLVIWVTSLAVEDWLAPADIGAREASSPGRLHVGMVGDIERSQH